MALLTTESQKKVLALISSEGLADASDVKKICQKAEEDNKPAFPLLIENNIVTDEVICRLSAFVLGVRYVDLHGVKIDQEILLNLPQNVSERNMVVPIGVRSDQTLVIASLDADNIQALDYFSTLSSKRVSSVMASDSSIREALVQYTNDFSNVNQAAKSSEAEKNKDLGDDLDNATNLVQDSPISKALNTILDFAAKSKASDIHIEPLEESLIIRCRIDGVLKQIMDLPKSIEPALISRIKILSNLKIDEHRIPQDGQFSISVAGRDIDLRIAISPVVWGEQVVIRLLDKNGTALEVEKMGMTGHALRDVLDGISKPNGMILTSGPTGSGKSTTLYALISKIKNESINIVTLEDPVEYKMNGINQIQVNVDAGLTFASGLRSILRQDPDVVMVGEIRDDETANLAVRAALTGHLVFSTLHTNSAAGILPRLIDMGIEPFLIASTLNTVIGQRLVRRVAEKRNTFISNDVQTKMLNSTIGNLLPKDSNSIERVSSDLGYASLPIANTKGYSLVEGIKTKESPDGYSGRAGLYETIAVDEDIQKLIVSRTTAADIMNVAKEKGTITMRQDGFLKALSGVTTLDEVNRVASDLA